MLILGFGYVFFFYIYSVGVPWMRGFARLIDIVKNFSDLLILVFLYQRKVICQLMRFSLLKIYTNL